MQIYNPREDDHRLRAAPRSFDQLRREYPERLEFSHYRIDATALTEQQRRQLQILGLSCN